MATPPNLRVTNGTMAQKLRVRFGKVRNALTYSMQHAEQPAGPYIDHAPFTATRTTVDDLTAGKMYWVRVSGNGSTGPSEWDAPVCKIVT